MQKAIVTNLSRPLVVPLELEVCDTFISRFRGLMFSKHMDSQKGILLVQPTETIINASIHMFFMNMDLFVTWLDSSLKVVDVVEAKKWHPFYAPNQKAKFIIETSLLQKQNFIPGDHLAIEYA